MSSLFDNYPPRHPGGRPQQVVASTGFCGARSEAAPNTNCFAGDLSNRCDHSAGQVGRRQERTDKFAS